MPKSKHWILLAAYADWLAHGRNYLAFKISEKMGMPYTPGCVPCEVVLNGDYIGMYFLTEQIRIAKERVNITEQDDEETDSTLITGGWLLEIDNYTETNQIRFTDPAKPNKTMKVTYHDPEELSDVQLNYLTNKVIPRLKKENSELKSVKIELTDALEKSTRKYFDQLDINEDLSNEIGKLGADGAVNKVRADKLEAELETIKSDYESKISDLKDELNSKDIHEVDKLKEQNKTLKQRIEDLNNDIDSLKDENNGLNSEIAELRKDLIEIGNYKEEVDKQNKDAISKYKEEISSLKTQLKVKESSYDKLSNENNKTITDLRKQVKKLEEQLEKESNKGLFNRFK